MGEIFGEIARRSQMKSGKPRECITPEEAGSSPSLCHFPRLWESAGTTMPLMKANSTVAVFPSDRVGGREAAVSRRKRLASRGGWQGSGFAAALVDVVLHKGNDLLELVVQLSAPCSGVRLQSAHHLTGAETQKREKTQQRWLSVAVEHSCIYLSIREREEISHLPGHRKLNDGEEAASSSGTSRVLQPLLHACLHTTKAFALHIFTKPTTAVCFFFHAQIVVTVSVGFMGS